jgi:AcrR family transcriptional regulator
MRKTATERRADIVQAALKEFSRRGLHGTTTDAIARAAGVSQPYLFRLYESKRDIFLAAGRYGFERTQEAFETATSGLHGDEALEAMKVAYDKLAEDRDLLMMQMQLYVAASSDEEIRQRVVRWWGELWRLCERLTDRFGDVIVDFMACGMLVNVMVALHEHEGPHRHDALSVPPFAGAMSSLLPDREALPHY